MADNFSPEMVSLLQQIRDNTAAAANAAKAGAGGDGDDTVSSWVKKISSATFQITDEIASAGRSFATSIGTTFTEGIRLEYNARTEFARQFKNYGADLAATVEQIKAAQLAAADAFINVPEGFRLSSQATGEFASGVKRAFGGEFKLTAENLRSFGLLGLTSAEQLKQFRESTGRAGLSTLQYDRTIIRNLPSLLIFGNRLAKSAVDLAQLGISMESYRATQQGVVTNLEGTLDTVNQLNQLGAQIDFETFARLSELGDPAETFRYLNNVIPDALLRTSTSFRALTEQLPGVKVDDLLRGGMEPSVKSLEQQFLELAKPDGALAEFTAALQSSTDAIKGSTGGLLTPATAAVGIGAIASALGASALAATGIGAIGALAVMGIPAIYSMIKGDDIISGYGSRTLVTPTGNVALNNNDTVIAGTRLFSEGALRTGGDSELNRKVDNLISTLQNATTTINVDGTMRTVPRMSLVGVYSRNERA